MNLRALATDWKALSLLVGALVGAFFVGGRVMPLALLPLESRREIRLVQDTLRLYRAQRDTLVAVNEADHSAILQRVDAVLAIVLQMQVESCKDRAGMDAGAVRACDPKLPTRTN